VARHGNQRLDDTPVPPANTVTPIDAAGLVEEAIRIAEGIERDALGDRESGVAWMTTRYVFAMDRFQLEVSGPGLYDGGCGVALFLAALHDATGDPHHRALALGAPQPILAELRSGNGARLAREVGPGPASGLGSFTYGLTRVAHLLDESSLLADARTAAMLVTRDMIGQDRTFDVVDGSAGAILGLLALYEIAPEPAILERVTWCGQHLLSHRCHNEDGCRAWASPSGQALAGFAHGAAGIAYALTRLAGATGQESFREAAAEAIAYEDGLFSTEHGNWPDLRVWTEEDPAFEYAISWCNGGPGIGLARLGGLEGQPLGSAKRDILAAANMVINDDGKGVDHLCCGNLGRANILLEIGLRLGRDELVDAAKARVNQVAHRARVTGSYRLWWETGGGISLPGLFQGTSGIGYALLRAAYPGRYPSVLLWQ
jgi:type 2 lantibiotic biosynthesis protein LanM